MTLNLTGASNSNTNNLASPTTPKVCNLSTFASPSSNKVVDKNNIDGSVTVTHFSENRGGVVEKISVPASITNLMDTFLTPDSGMKTKMDNFQRENNRESEVVTSTTTTSINNNPFLNREEVLTSTIITTSTATSPTIKISTNPFRNSFNSSDRSDRSLLLEPLSPQGADKSLKITFPIVATNPFKNGDGNGNGVDEMDNEVNVRSLTIDNENNITTIKMDNIERRETNGYKNEHKQVTFFDGLVMVLILRRMDFI